jgi:hypothetical protein
MGVLGYPTDDAGRDRVAGAGGPLEPSLGTPVLRPATE